MLDAFICDPAPAAPAPPASADAQAIPPAATPPPADARAEKLRLALAAAAALRGIALRRAPVQDTEDETPFFDVFSFDADVEVVDAPAPAQDFSPKAEIPAPQPRADATPATPAPPTPDAAAKPDAELPPCDAAASRSARRKQKQDARAALRADVTQQGLLAQAAARVSKNRETKRDVPLNHPLRNFGMPR